MAKNFGRVNVSISASTGALTKGLKSASSQMQSFQGQVKSINSRMGALVLMQGAQMFAGFIRGVTSAVRSLISMGQAQTDVIGRQKDLAAQLGMSYSQLAGIAHVANITGVGIESVATAATKADVALVKAQKGSKQAQAAFAGLGLDVAQLAAMNPADRFNAIAQAIANIPDAAGRSSAAVALFGKSGANLLPIFEEGAAGIAAAQAEAKRLGLTLTTAQVSNVDQMGDSFARVQQAISGVVGQIVAHLAPAINSVALAFTDFVGSIGGANIGQAIGEALLDAAEFLAQVGDYIIANLGPPLQAVFSYLSQVGAQWGGIFGIAGRVAAAFTGAFQLFQSAGSGVGFILAKVIEQLARAGAAIASVIPGGSDAQKFLQSVQAGAGNMANTYAKATQDAFNASMTNFETVLGDTSVGDAIATPLTDAVQGFRRAAREAATAIDEAVDKPAQVKTAVEVSSKELKAIVAGSSAGETFRNSLMRGADPRAAGDAADRETADNTGEAVDLLEDLPDNLATAMNSQFGLASITA